MCGRFALTMDLPELQAAFPWVEFGTEVKPRYNIAPSQYVLTIPNLPGDKALPFRWGLIPFWAKDMQIGYKMINARAETLAEKPLFKMPFRKQRCLILADGFFEWKKDGNKKRPYFIKMKDSRPFAFAGLWEKWQPPDRDPVYSCTIITTDANEAMKPIHHRMPAILSPKDHQTWLFYDASADELLTELLKSDQNDDLIAFPISPSINNPRNDSPDCIQPVSA